MSETETKKITPVLYPWQGNAWDQLNNAVSSQRLAHAILLQGMPDSGIEGFAELFAQRLLCGGATSEASTGHLPCGQCRECLLFLAGTHPGFLEISPLENEEGKVSLVIKIDQIRESVDFVMQTSMQQGMKIILIHPAEAMNPNAANALLKNLEEPPANTRFLLVTNHPARLMATIRSRCQVVDITLPTFHEADQWLSLYIQEASERAQLLSLSAGNPLLVKQWQDDSCTTDIFELHKNLSEVLSKKSSPLVLAKSWAGQGAERLTWWWRWLLLDAKQSAAGDSLSKTGNNFSLSSRQLVIFMEKLLAAKRQLESSANPNEQLLLESLLIDWQQLG